MRDTIGRSPWILASVLAITLIAASSAADAAQFYRVGDNNLPKAVEPADEAGGQPGDEALKGAPIDTKAIFGKQAELVAEQIDGLAEERRGKTDLYAVLLAGHPYQRVFMREIEAIGGILGRRFDARGRIARLANSATDPGRYPLATTENLARILSGVAAEMNPLEDVLFLYLTSHGAPGRLDAGFPELNAGDVTAEGLARALDNAGIRQAVIVVSACHSGSFLPYLDRPGYAVLAASAADRSSFGCSDANDWTWFGRALFEVGLEDSADIRTAFEDAKVWVATAEKKEGFEPSEPQIQIGAQAYRFLDRLADPAMR